MWVSAGECVRVAPLAKVEMNVIQILSALLTPKSIQAKGKVIVAGEKDGTLLLILTNKGAQTVEAMEGGQRANDVPARAVSLERMWRLSGALLMTARMHSVMEPPLVSEAMICPKMRS